MTSYMRKSFSVGAPASDDYRGNWERTFRQEAPVTADPLADLPRDVTRDVQALFEAAELVLSVEHPAARTMANEIRALAYRIALLYRGLGSSGSL